MSTSNSGIPLSELEPLAVCFLDYVEQLGRPLTKKERHAFHWILVCFESEQIVRDCRRECVDEGRVRYIAELMAGVRKAIFPYPVRRVGIVHKREVASAELVAGNNKLKSLPFAGVSMRRKLTDSESSERLSLLLELVAGIGVIIRELGHAKGDRKVISRIQGHSKKAAESCRKFASDYSLKIDHKTDDLERAENDARALAEIMKGKAIA